jgi:tetratricopeptide (TPR) repeat protein/tRNA A-37 threonylcarbamoyl transferase component Bud32
MDDARRERLKESLRILDELSADQRRTWITERLADDPELAAEVARLMDVSVGDRLAPLVVPPESLRATQPLPPRIGPFVVDGLIGQGGMGSVYRAHQMVPVKRRAAVKVLRSELGGPQFLERFEDERMAVARMEHRNVARLLDAGTAEDGRSYIAMELVDGPPITEYAALHCLSLRDRLALFVQVCRGVQHAHNRGILHRDLKPSNILVADEDARPVPKVIDFGVSKLLATDATRSGRTLAGQLLGTLGYMSPEQADRVHPDADVRSDVYALGTILYELLTGSLPVPPDRLHDLAVADLSEVLRTHPRVPPSRAARMPGARPPLDGVPSELDCLVLKATAPDPDERYASASELAADIERFLHGLPIAARPPSVSYRARKFLARHRVAAVTAAVVLAALITGTALAAAGFRRAVVDRRAAEAALQTVQDEKRRADESLARAEEVASYLRSLLMRAHPSQLGPKATFDALLKAAAADFLDERPADPLVRAEVASALAEPLYVVGDYETVERLLLEEVDALALLPMQRAASLRVSMMLRLGYVASRQSRPRDAEERFQKAVEFARAADSPTLTFQTQGALAQTLSTAGRYDEAIAMLRAMIDSDVAQGDELLRASALSNLGVAYGRKGAAAEGLPFAREGYEIRLRRAPKDPTTHNMGWQLGISYMENGLLDDSVRTLEETHRAARDAVGDDHADVLAGVVLLHYARARRGDGPVVLPPIRAAIARQREVGIPQQQLAQSRMYLAGALLHVGDLAEALAEADRTIEELAATLPSGCDRGVVTVLLQFGSMLSAGGAPRESLPYLERAFECTRTNPAVAPLAPRVAGAIVWSHRRLGDEEAAQRWRAVETELRGGGGGSGSG